MRGRTRHAGCALGMALALACASRHESGTTPVAPPAGRAIDRAVARLDPKSDSQLSGSAVFVRQGRSIALELEIEGAPPGEHAVHLHEHGDCSAPDGASAGGHWNPTTEDHGRWGARPHHLGDIGNVVVGPDGKGLLELTTDRWSMGPGQSSDILGKSVIVHSGADDFKTQPTGAAGGRIGCGVIRAQ